MSRGPVVVIHHSPAHTMAHITTFQRPTTGGAQNHCWCSVLLSAPTFCGHPSPTATFSSSGALRLCFPLLTTCHVTAFTLFFTRRAPFTSAPCHRCNLHKLFSLPVQYSFSPSSFASSPCPPNQPPSSKAAARLQRWPKQFASSASSCCLCLKGQRLIPTAYRSACCWSLEHCSGSR